MAKKTADPCQDEYKKTQQAQKELLAKTTDEEIGKMYRIHKEATEFFQSRGIYI
jgi:hypothetical protein